MMSDEISATGRGPSVALRLFCLALMVPACGINGVFIALAIPSLAPYGIAALVVVGIVGALIGIWPAKWLAVRIHHDLKE